MIDVLGTYADRESPINEELYNVIQDVNKVAAAQAKIDAEAKANALKEEEAMREEKESELAEDALDRKEEEKEKAEVRTAASSLSSLLWGVHFFFDLASVDARRLGSVLA